MCVVLNVLFTKDQDQSQSVLQEHCQPVGRPTFNWSSLDPVGKVVILNSAPILDGSPWSGQRPRGPQRPQSAPQRPPWAEYEIPREPSTTEAAWLGIRQLCASMKRESK